MCPPVAPQVAAVDAELDAKMRRVLYAVARQEVLQHYDADGACCVSLADARHCFPATGASPAMDVLVEFDASVPVHHREYHTLLTWHVYDDTADERIAYVSIGLDGRPGESLRMRAPRVDVKDSSLAAWTVAAALEQALQWACDAFNACPVHFVDRHVPVPNDRPVAHVAR
jgi:hypothetical protein